MGHSKKHKHASNSKSSTGISARGRKKAFWLLIILGVVVMLVYALSFQDAEDSELIQETQPQSGQLETTQ
ncbi:MAG: hypothetical protein KAJ31_02900 [Deltaproteobacteria bacterium]|nr:hypothetical protein [Deltaproteobacteria bacterium]